MMIFRDHDGDICVTDGRQNNLVFCPARDDDGAVLCPDVIDEIITRFNGDQPERIVAAAIQIEGMTISLPQPARHGHVHMACDAAHIPREVYLGGTQGFLTSTGRFVNRVMAKHIAHRAGQQQMRPEKERSHRDLYSEDLW